MTQLRTEFPFSLPKGYLDQDGTVHTEGTMRLATARDELEPLNDPKVRDADDPYLTVIVLSRVITGIGPHTRLSPRDVEQLFAADLAYLQDVYSTINYGTQADVDRLIADPRGQRAAAARAAQDEAAPLAAVPAAPATATPISDAARSILAGADGPVPTADADHLDDEPVELETRRSSPRSRIEEVGRSGGRSGGSR